MSPFAWAEGWFCRAGAAAHEMRYPREAVGIQRRYRRVADSWKPHVAKCHDIILRAADACPRRRTCAVLGGGLIHDVPLIELASRFERVLLVDIVHPLRSRWRTRKIPRLERISADITGVVGPLYRAGVRVAEQLPRSKPGFALPADLDLTISLNLASQLPCMIEDWLRRWRRLTEAEIAEYSRHLIAAHLAWLKSLPGGVCVITDTERIRVDALRRVDEEIDLLHGVRFAGALERWTWELAPAGEVLRDRGYFRRVVGAADFASVSVEWPEAPSHPTP